jgi:hypothetical protein
MQNLHDKKSHLSCFLLQLLLLSFTISTANAAELRVLLPYGECMELDRIREETFQQSRKELGGVYRASSEAVVKLSSEKEREPTLSAKLIEASEACRNQHDEAVKVDQERRAKIKARALKPEPKLGMTKAAVISSTNWGEPVGVNRTQNQSGVTEQWVYEFDDGRGYLYFRNGRLVTIQD